MTDSKPKSRWGSWLVLAVLVGLLGLAIAVRRAAECGGRLEWQSPVKDKRGARFCVTLPLESGSSEIKKLGK